jgi:RimJ/RimL family protein N-acetyltransferase
MFEGWAQDIEAVRYLAWSPHTDVSQTKAHIARCESAWLDGSAYVYFIALRATGDVVGSLASRRDAHGVNLGYVLGRPYWGHGYMTEAVRHLAAWWLADGGVHRVWATCHPANAQSGRALEKAGFSLEGTLRKWGTNPNVSADPCDHLCFSLVRGTS